MMHDIGSVNGFTHGLSEELSTGAASTHCFGDGLGEGVVLEACHLLVDERLRDAIPGSNRTAEVNLCCVPMLHKGMTRVGVTGATGATSSSRVSARDGRRRHSKRGCYWLTCRSVSASGQYWLAQRRRGFLP